MLPVYKLIRSKSYLSISTTPHLPHFPSGSVAFPSFGLCCLGSFFKSCLTFPLAVLPYLPLGSVALHSLGLCGLTLSYSLLSYLPWDMYVTSPWLVVASPSPLPHYSVPKSAIYQAAPVHCQGRQHPWSGQTVYTVLYTSVHCTVY